MLFMQQKTGYVVTIFCLTILTGLLTTGMAQKDVDNGYTANAREYLRFIFHEGQYQYSFRDDDPKGVEGWQMQARPLLQELVALEKIAQQVGDHVVNVELEESCDMGEYTRRQGWIETEPGVRIKFWLLKPKSSGPYPLGIFPHGHGLRSYDTYAGVFADEETRQEKLAEDRDVAVQAVKRGFLAIAPATRGLADGGYLPDLRKRHGDRKCRAQFMHCLLAGRTAIGERVWDMQRLLDWALSRDDVDGDNILMMGNSGGGMVTIYAAACDERITIAVPSCSFSTLSTEDGYIAHCDCNMIPGLLHLGEIWDVAGLIAPRHLLAVNGKTDNLHKNADIERAVRHTQIIYDAADVPDRFEHRWGEEGHRFYSHLMWDFVMEAVEK